MKNKWVALILIFSSCSTNYDEIKGGWEMVRHDYHDQQTNESTKDAEFPFNYMFVIGDSIFIDNDPGRLYSLKKDSLSFYFSNDRIDFLIVDNPDSHLLLESQNYSPGSQSFYYFRKIED